MDKSVFEFPFKGKTVGLRFGTKAFKHLQENTKETVSESLSRLAAGKLDIGFLCDFFLAAAVDYAKTNKIEVQYTIDDMCDWIDEIGGVTKAMEIVGNGVEQYFPKN